MELLLNGATAHASTTRIVNWVEECGVTEQVFLERISIASAKLQAGESLSVDINSLGTLKSLAVSKVANHIGEVVLAPEHNDMNLIPHLLSQFPSLFSLGLKTAMLDLASDVLEHHGIQLRAMSIRSKISGNGPRFFAALQHSKVTRLSLTTTTAARCESALNSEFITAFLDYLALDRLQTLVVGFLDEIPKQMLTHALGSCTQLKDLQVFNFECARDVDFLPQSLTQLGLFHVALPAGGTEALCKWLKASEVSSLRLHEVEGLDGELLAEALADGCALHLETLSWYGSDFTATAAMQVFQIMKTPSNALNTLRIQACEGNWFFQALASALTHESCVLDTLTVQLQWPCTKEEQEVLNRALSNNRCRLKSLQLGNCYALSAEEKKRFTLMRKELSQALQHRRTILVLLFGQQMRRANPRCKLKRLPHELVRMVGALLL